MELMQSNLTGQIIKSFYKVYNTLGYGFLEKVYEKSLFFELSANGLSCSRQYPINVYYSNHNVGDYYADMIVEDKVILELKAAETLCEEHEFQIINYLKATKIEVGLLLNFGLKPAFKRKVFMNQNK